MITIRDKCIIFGYFYVDIKPHVLQELSERDFEQTEWLTYLGPRVLTRTLKPSFQKPVKVVDLVTDSEGEDNYTFKFIIYLPPIHNLPICLK